MKLSEKTLELNFCSQFAKALGRRVLWFGLTQRQEARWGFDAATRLGGGLLLFQFKASNDQLRMGARRFRASHSQLRALQQHNGRVPKRILYALPNVGTSYELNRRPNILNQTWLLEVASLPDPFPRPTVSGGTRLRKTGLHYFDLIPPQLMIHSDLVETSVQTAVTFAERLDLDEVDTAPILEWSEPFVSAFSRPALGGVIIT